MFYLAATIDAPEETPLDPVGALGVDLGLKHLAYDSDGAYYSGDRIDEEREKTAKLRAGLQSRGSKSAKRRLRKLSGRMHRFRTDVNHQISKRLVAKSKGARRRIAV